MLDCPLCYGTGFVPTGDDPHSDNPETDCPLCREQGEIAPEWHSKYQHGKLEEAECEHCGHLAHVTKARRLCYRCWLRDHNAGQGPAPAATREPAPF